MNRFTFAGYWFISGLNRARRVLNGFSSKLSPFSLALNPFFSAQYRFCCN